MISVGVPTTSLLPPRRNGGLRWSRRQPPPSSPRRSGSSRLSSRPSSRDLRRLRWLCICKRRGACRRRHPHHPRLRHPVSRQRWWSAAARGTSMVTRLRPPSRALVPGAIIAAAILLASAHRGHRPRLRRPTPDSRSRRSSRTRRAARSRWENRPAARRPVHGRRRDAA